MVGQTTLNIMKIKFANGKTYEGVDVDEAIAKCLADGNDPFNPVIVESKPVTAKQDKIETENANRE